MTYAYSLFIPCVNYPLHEFLGTDMRIDGYETQLRLAPARGLVAEVSSGSVIHCRCATPMGSGLDIQHGLIITADVYLRTDMHHDYMTSLYHLHRI